MKKEFIKKENLKKSGGFTLLETLVAITILVLSIVGPMTVASKGLQSAIYAKNEITAFYLGQEAIEYIRNARDTNLLKDCYSTDVSAPDCHDKTQWLHFLDECIDPKVCYFDVRKDYSLGGSIKECDSGDCPPIDFDEDTNIYSYDKPRFPSKYTRTVKIEHINHTGIGEDEEARVTVVVSWKDSIFFSGDDDRKYTISENLLNWQR